MAKPKVTDSKRSKPPSMGVRRAIERLFGVDEVRGGRVLPQANEPESSEVVSGKQPDIDADVASPVFEASGDLDEDESPSEEPGVTSEESAVLLSSGFDESDGSEASADAGAATVPEAKEEQAEGSASAEEPPAWMETAAGERPSPAGRRQMFRTNVDLPANMEIAGKDVPVHIQNLSGTGAALVYKSADPIPQEGNWLDLALPNRPKPMELEVKVIRTRESTDEKGEKRQIVHVTFPSIRRGETDNIIAYINNIRIYEGKQYAVAATVKMEVVTGRRRFAKFTGQTMEIRPDKMKLLMDDFDVIAGAEVMLTIMAPHFADHIDVEDVTIEKVDVVGPRKAEVEVAIKKPNDNVLLFIRKHYPGVGKSRR